MNKLYINQGWYSYVVMLKGSIHSFYDIIKCYYMAASCVQLWYLEGISSSNTHFLTKSPTSLHLTASFACMALYGYLDKSICIFEEELAP